MEVAGLSENRYLTFNGTHGAAAGITDEKSNTGKHITGPRSTRILSTRPAHRTSILLMQSVLLIHLPLKLETQ